MEEKIKNLTFIVIFGFVITFALIIGLYFKGGEESTETKTPSNTSANNTTTKTEYDVSKMDKVDVEGALDLLDDGKTHVLYIGRSTCSVCVKMVPVLNEAQEDYDYRTNYLEIGVSEDKTWSDWQKELKPLTDKMNVTATANGEEGTLGELFYNKGYTPTIVIIKKGKVVDGFIGYKSLDSFKAILDKYYK